MKFFKEHTLPKRRIKFDAYDIHKLCSFLYGYFVIQNKEVNDDALVKRINKLRGGNYYITVFAAVAWFAFYPSETLKAQDTVFHYNPWLTSYYHVNEPSSELHLDTSITHFNRYNPVEDSFGYLHTGHLGAAAAPMFYKPPVDASFDIGFHQFNPYWRASDAVKFYDSRQPFTQVGYQQGTKVEVLGSFIHTQNILPQLSIGVDMNRYRTDGFYQRQVSKITNFDAFARYESQNGFYHANVAYVLNSLKVEENGGVENLDVFSDTSLLDKSTQPVLLDSAYVNWKSDVVFFQNAFDLGKKELVQKNDSVQYQKVVPELRLQHFFKWEKGGYRFKDAAIDSAFYSNIYVDSLLTRDTLSFTNYCNEFRLRVMERSVGLLRGMQADIYYRHDFYRINSLLGENQVQSGIGGLELHQSFLNDSTSNFQIDFHLMGQYSFFDYNAGDFHIDFKTDLHIATQNSVTFALQFSKNHPSFIQQNYLSNHFSWSNDFKPYQSSTATISWLEKKWRLKLAAQVFNVANYLYWNQSALPSQFSDMVNGYSFFLQKDFTLKGFHLDNEFQYQSFSNDTVFAYPQFIARNSFYFQNRLFKGALTSKMGFDVRYNTNYFAPAYMPETGQFYIQRNSLLSYYPVIDLFLTIQVKGVRAFIMLQHINKDLFASGYYAVYRSPMPDRAFKLGLEWRFWN